MSEEVKRLAIIATLCFFPTALAGWLLYAKSEKKAIALFQFSVFLMMGLTAIAGVIVVINGGKLIKPMGSFF